MCAIALLSRFADEYKAVPTLAFTHFQPAQPTTVGKRATPLTQEFLMDLEEVEYRLSRARLLGSKGTTGTRQVSSSCLRAIMKNAGSWTGSSPKDGV